MSAFRNFIATLKQAPRSPHGKHRRAGPPAHRHTAEQSSGGAGGTAESDAPWTTGNTTIVSLAARTEPIPYAGVRTGEIIGYRMWWVIDGRLCSQTHHHLWEPGRTESGDVNGIWRGGYCNTHRIPLGVYAFRGPAQLAAEVDYWARTVAEMDLTDPSAIGIVFMLSGFAPLLYTQTFAVGTVKMWGDVVEHQHGYRAQFAKVNSIDKVFIGPRGPTELVLEHLRALYEA